MMCASTFVEMGRVELPSELGCLHASTVCSSSQDLSGTGMRQTESCITDLQECQLLLEKRSNPKPHVYYTATLTMRPHARRCRIGEALVTLSRMRSPLLWSKDFLRYSLHVKFACIVTNSHALPTLHTKTMTNRRCLASPENTEMHSMLSGKCVRFWSQWTGL